MSWFNFACWLTNTKQPSLHLALPPGTSWPRCLDTRSSTRSEVCFQRWELGLHHSPLVPLRPHASRSTLSCSPVVPTGQPSSKATNMPSGGKRSCNWCHRLENTSLFALRGVVLCQWGICTGKLKIYKMTGSKYCAKKKCNTMIPAPRRHKHPSSSPNRPADVATTVNINDEFNLMAVNPMIECFSRNLVPEYCQGLESSTVYLAPPFFIDFGSGRSSRSLPRLPLHTHVQKIIPAF